MNRRLEHRTKRLRESILLIEDNKIIGSWLVTPNLYASFLATARMPSLIHLWSMQECQPPTEKLEDLVKPEDFGELVLAIEEKTNEART